MVFVRSYLDQAQGTSVNIRLAYGRIDSEPWHLVTPNPTTEWYEPSLCGRLPARYTAWPQHWAAGVMPPHICSACWARLLELPDPDTDPAFASLESLLDFSYDGHTGQNGGC